MKTVRKIDVYAGAVIDQTIRKAIAEAGDDIVEFDFNGVTVQVESDSDPQEKYTKWNEAMEANRQRAIEKRDRQEHPERYWSPAAPTIPGWYWCRADAGTRGEEVEVVKVWSWTPEGMLQFRFGRYDYHVNNAGRFQFAGPLESPR